MEDSDFRMDKIRFLKDPLRTFWCNFGNNYNIREKPFESSISRVRALLDSPECYEIFKHPAGKFHMDKAIDSKKIIIVSGAQGSIGEESCRLFLSIFLDLFVVSCQRNILPHKYYVIADEFELYVTDTISRSLALMRNYNVSFVLAHQYINQVEKEIMDAVLANADTKFVYRVSAKDAKELAPEFKDVRVSPRKLADLAKYEAFVLDDGEYSHAKMARLRHSDSRQRREMVIKSSRMRFSRKREVV